MAAVKKMATPAGCDAPPCRRTKAGTGQPNSTPKPASQFGRAAPRRGRKEWQTGAALQSKPPGDPGSGCTAPIQGKSAATSIPSMEIKRPTQKAAQKPVEGYLKQHIERRVIGNRIGRVGVNLSYRYSQIGPAVPPG